MNAGTNVSVCVCVSVCVGVLSEDEFTQLLLALDPHKSEQDIAQLLADVDPHNLQQATFSQVRGWLVLIRFPCTVCSLWL